MRKDVSLANQAVENALAAYRQTFPDTHGDNKEGQLLDFMADAMTWAEGVGINFPNLFAIVEIVHAVETEDPQEEESVACVFCGAECHCLDDDSEEITDEQQQ